MRAIAILPIIILISCSKTTDKEVNSAKFSLKKASIKDSINTSLLQKVQTSKTNSPCIEFLDFITELEKGSWSSDTARLLHSDIYPEIDRTQIEYFDKHPFYPVKFENTALNNSFEIGLLNTEEADSISLNNFKKVKNIWTYFYRDKNATNMLTDGVIEQWEFDTEQQAQIAYKKIIKIGDLVYFNTNPYFYTLDNKLFIFHTRAMKFSLKQGKVFKSFKSKIS